MDDITQRPTCSVRDCLKPVKSIRSGLCNQHYRKSILTDICIIDGCDRPARPDKMCPACSESKRMEGMPPCRFEGCRSLVRVVSSGLCNGHHLQMQKHGEMKPLSRLKGTGSYENGYLFISKNGISKGEHRWVMEERLGRELTAEESVHHINGIRDDNCPENLELWSSSQPPGQRVSDKLAWAHELIQRYETTPQSLLYAERIPL